ncbi:MAG TPA: chorismate synthase [Bacteroidales bacterium]|jgi:chorismate synthase|nr:chorismate synthase [Bacteroidales bacterium]MCZ2416109.1 chorismate synthase [Burkholderiales bacterium]OQC58584.1 MAG: Chorismate synthase [Bacteroidetes bacterium ADurb.Bin013]MBP8999356.1 chorismate synthase [Bacteroidales bacterium]MBV6455155.1 Chorismate synthase [Bacteroidales bacterium]
MNVFGRNFRVAVYGESHGPEVGVLLDGVPPGILLSEIDFQEDIARRKSGAPGTTRRQEADEPLIRSGMYRGYTSGSPLCISFLNRDARSQDYLPSEDSDPVQKLPHRPGTADYTGDVKFRGFQDPRGGGHFSGRLTLPLVAAGVVAKRILAGRFPDMTITAFLTQVGGIPVIDKRALPGEVNTLLEQAVEQADSLGAVISCEVTNIPAGLGNPFFDSVESLLSHGVFSIPGVKGITFGLGFDESLLMGSQNPHIGGIAGGITNGDMVSFQVAVKPTPTVGGKGRHDACFALRVPVVVEAVTAMVIADLMMTSA